MLKFSNAPLTAAELAERKTAAAASAKARAATSHRGETAPSVKQGSSGAPSRQAIGLFRQGQARTDTRATRSPWDTRPTEAPIGALNARFTLHAPKAYITERPNKPPFGRKTLARERRKLVGTHQDVEVTNPRTLADAQRQPQLRGIINNTIGVIRGHQAGAIEQGHARKLIPEGTPPALVARAYKHAALKAAHKAGLGDYSHRMDDAAKAAFTPLVPFMRYAHRRVFDHLNQGDLNGKWKPFRDEFGQLYRQKKHGQLTGHERMRMRPDDEFIKQAALEDLEKAWTHYDLHQGGRETPPIAGSAKRTFKEQVDQVHQAGTPPIANTTEKLPDGRYRVRPAQPAETCRPDEVGSLKKDFSAALGSYNTNPKTQLARAIHPRLRRNRLRLRLNTQRDLHRLLNGGVTRQERWQLGAASGLPVMKRDSDKVGLSSLLTEADVRAAARRAKVPTKPQAEAGNYRMGHVAIGGLRISIETPKGRIRRGVGPGGKPWSVTMPAHYGYIKGSEGADGDHLDCYLGPHAHAAEQHTVHVVDQHDADSKAFDEHKCLLGFADRKTALASYDAAFSDGRGPQRRQAVHTMDFADFKRWVGDGETTKPMKKGLIAGLAAGALAGKAAGAIHRGIAGRGIRRAARDLYTQDMKTVMREHMRVFDGGTPSPHQQAAARATFRQAKHHAAKEAIRTRNAKLAGVRAPRGLVAGATLAGGAAGLTLNSRAPALPPLYQSAVQSDTQE